MPVSIPREFIAQLLEKIDLVDLINTHIPLRKKSAHNYFACCPFHSEKSASFSVSQPKQFYHCFGCGAHGNAIDFIMQHERLSFPETIRSLASQVGMSVPTEPGSVKKEDHLAPLYELVTQVVKYYQHALRQAPTAIQYLKNRGITGLTAQRFHLGYAPSGWHHVLDQFGKNAIQSKALLDTGLIIKKNDGGYYDRFRDRIMFPIQDYRGRMIGFGGRVIDQGEPKYLNSPETSLFQKGHELYGLYQALQANRHLERVVIVEGYMDVIALFQHDITYAVATLGTATTQHHLQRLFRYTTQMIFCFDGDAAGRTAAERALSVILPIMQDNFDIRFLFLPDNEDPDSLIRKEGKEAFEHRITTALSLSAFFFQHLGQHHDVGSLEGRSRFAVAALTMLKLLPSGLFQSMMLSELAKRARIDLDEIKQQLGAPQTVTAEQLASSIAPTTTTPKSKLPMPVRLFMALLIQYPALAQHITEPLPKSLPGYTFLAKLIEITQASPHISTGHLVEYWRGQKEEQFVAKLAQWDTMMPPDGIENEFRGVLRQLLTRGIDEEINALLAKAAHTSLSDEEKASLSAWIAKKKSNT